jgi:hypothetical protein
MIIQHQEELSGNEYSLIAKLRFDILPLAPIFSTRREVRELLELVDISNTVLIPPTESYGGGTAKPHTVRILTSSEFFAVTEVEPDGREVVYQGINDRFVIGGREAMLAVFNFSNAFKAIT